MSHRWLGVLLLLLITSAPRVMAQTTVQSAPINVFLDCQTHDCDSAFFRTEIGFVNWVRDRTAADVHLLITSSETGSGGSNFSLSFFGLTPAASDTLQLSISTPQTATDSEQRDALTNRIAQGLLYYAIRTTSANRVSVITKAAGDTSAAPPSLVDDPWDHWVFSIGVNGSADGEARQASRNFEVGLSAGRVTEIWKFEVGTEGSYREDRYELDDGELRVVRRDYNSEAQITRALAALWSAGAEAEVGTSTFRNQDLYARIAPVLEYSFYPYSDFSRRRITLQYSVGANYYDYAQETIFDKTSEYVYDEKLQLSANFQQPWGSAGTYLWGSHYFHDLSRYDLGIDAHLGVRLLRGLSVELGGSYSRVHNQLYIQKGDATDEDVLTERLALATGYEYDFRIGLNSTFGSIFNNVVNRRID
jgi:hypothetical protein